MKLIYVNKVGVNWKDENIYEFIFNESGNDIDGEGWDSFPAAGNPSPPHKQHIDKVGYLISGVKLNVIQDSDSFSMWDSVDGVISLSWEDVMSYDEYPDKRVFFGFGEDIKSVESKLYEKDLILNYNEIIINV